MTGHGERGWVRNWAGVASVLLLGLLAPSPVEAACGDHVQYGKPGLRADEPNTPPPCRGPQCSRRDADSLPAPVPPPTTVNDHAALHAPPVSAGGEQVGRLTLVVPAYTSPVHSSIFHPPRVS